MIEREKNNLSLNKEVNTYLNCIIKKKTFANGYVFYGAEGLGKKQTALRFIKEIFKQTSPRGNIEERITNNNHPDFLMIEPSSSFESKKSKNSDSEKRKIGTEIIKIAQIRNIKNFLGQKSVESRKKVVLLVDAHLLNEASSNCLLKTLEEPSNGIFILLTSKLNLLLDTIISRCQLVRFRSLSGKKIELFLKDYLQSTNLDFSNKLNFQDLVNLANGSPGQLIKFFEIWKEFSDEITGKLDNPKMNSIDIIEVSQLISEQLEIYQQICLVNFYNLCVEKNKK